MEAKYYTPDIEEFHVGFEYEYFIMDNWQPVGYHPSDMAEADKFFETLYSNKIRVKCLGKEDVEDLGFKLSDDICPYNGKIIFKTAKKSDDFLDGYIHHHELYFTNSKKIMIYKISYGGFTGNETNKEKVFDGYLKNKNELKRLMQQLNIE